jgi:hypothetical protein
MVTLFTATRLDIDLGAELHVELSKSTGKVMEKFILPSL